MDIPAGSNTAVAFGAEGVGLVAALIAAVAFGGDDGDLAALHLTALDVADVLGGGAGDRDALIRALLCPGGVRVR